MNISAVIVIKGNPPHLNETFDSIEGFVSEIILGVIDIEPALKKNLEKDSRFTLFDLPADVRYADLVKEDLKKKASGDYILYLDPDEVLPKEVRHILNDKCKDCDYFYIPRKNFIFGKWIAHSRWWPDYQLRFFKRDAVVWPRTIHPVPEATGKEYKIEPKEEYALIHYNYENLDEFMEKFPRYAKGDALERIERNDQYTFRDALKKGIAEFISRFFVGEGFKDGTHGLVLAFLQMFYYLLVYFYMWEFKKYPEMKVNEMVEIADEYFKQGLYETKFWKVKTKLAKPTDKLKLKIVKRL